MVYSVLENKLEDEDRFLHRLAYQVAGIMLASGNMKKNTSAEDVVKSVYAPIIPEEVAKNAPQRKDIITDQEEARKFVTDLASKIDI